MTPDDVRARLLAIWGQQACQDPEQWPGVLERLVPKGDKNGNYRPRVEAAVIELAVAFGGTEPPADPENAVWRAFSPLDPEHRRQLAATLLALRAAERRDGELAP